MTLHAALAEHTQRQDLDGAVAVLMDGLARVPGLAKRLEEAGIEPGAVRTVADLDALPVLSKDEMLQRQADDPPFGGLLAVDAAVQRVFQSPGPLYEPQLRAADSWRWGQVLRSLGVGPDDTVLNCFGYHLSPAGAMMEEGALAVGARVLPGGIGSQELQVRAIADLAVTAYTGLPSYLNGLIERYDAAGLPAERWLLSKAMVTAEPLPDSLRALLQARVADVRMAYGTGETGLLAFETGDGAGLALADGVLVQVCELGTGEPITDEREGEVVVTALRPEYPLVRFGTGDLSGWMLGPDGTPRLRGVLGRVGQAVKVKGMFLHPVQVSAVMAQATGVAGYRFVIGREKHVDTLRCEVVVDDGHDPLALEQDVTRRIREGLRFRADVVAVRQLTDGDGPVVDTRDWS